MPDPPSNPFPAPDALLALRPAIAGAAPYALPQTVGDFLHQTLRPVLKLQNALLLLTVADYLHEHHIPLARRNPPEQLALVAEVLTRNLKLRYTIIGLLAGVFTAPETAFYRQHRAELNRRVLELATRRVQNQLPALLAALQELA